MVVTADAPVLTLMPPEPTVRVPNEPWLMVTAPVPELSTFKPATEKFWSSVVTTGAAPALVALKLTVFAAPGVNPALVVPAASVDQLVLPALLPFQLLPATTGVQ